MEIHIVSRGETVFGIALRYGVSAERIIRDNGLSFPYMLSVGEALLILYPEVTHTVRSGETLSGIAREYEIGVNQLLRNNPPLTRETLLQPGEELVIRYQQPKRGSFLVNAYAYPQISNNLLERVLPYLTTIIPFTYGYDAQGRIIPMQDREILKTAEEYGISATLHLSTLNERGFFNSDAAVRMMTDSAVRQTLITNLINLMTEKGYRALDVDFEYIPPEYTYEYYDFLRVLQLALSSAGYTLIVALAPKISAEQRGLLYEAHDYALIGSVADYVFLMTYEWGYTYGPPMAVAPIESVRRVLDYAVSEILPEKILMGIPIYGYDWTLPHVPGTAARSLSPVEAIELAVMQGSEIEYDTVAQAPFFRYTDAGESHIVWFEDVRSIRQKLNLAREYTLAGVGYWQAGRIFPGNWTLLNAEYEILTE